MRRAARIVAVLGAVSIAACFTKPREPHVADGGADDDADARMIDAPVDAPSGCVKDNFDNTAIMNCETWGDATLSTFATITRANQTLRFHFSDSTSSASGQCQTRVPIDITNGTSIRIVTFASYMMSLSMMVPGQSVPVTFSFMQGAMVPFSLSCPGQAPLGGMIGTTPVWMQLRVVNPGAGGVRVVAEYATTTNFTSWSFAQQCTFSGVVPTKAVVSFAGSGYGVSNADFDDFNVKNCP